MTKPQQGFVDAADVIHFESIGSTNEEALARGRAGELGPFWIRAEVQTSGRGRLGRTWASPKGNLYTSLLLHAPADGQCLPQLAHVAAVALAEAIQQTCGVRPIVKWPNDLLISGAKVAGILIEGTRAPDGFPMCAVGWGVNCQHHPQGLPYAAADLSAATGRLITPDFIFQALRAAMTRAMALWDEGRNYPAIRAAWLAHAVPVGTAMAVTSGANVVQGTFHGIDCDGRLLLQSTNGLVRIEAGEVVLQEQSAPFAG